jgi:hypothetical protein
MHALAMPKNIAQWLTVIVVAIIANAVTSFSAERPVKDARASATVVPESGRLVVDVHGIPPPAPIFFSAVIAQSVRLSAAEITGEMRVRLRVVQGRPEVLTLGLSGDGDVVEVSGKGLRDWAVRQGVGADAGKRFLDLRPLRPIPLAASNAVTLLPVPEEMEVVVRTRLRKPSVPGNTALLIATPGEAVGFTSSVSL